MTVANPLSRSSDMVDRRFVFNRFNVENVRPGESEVTGSVTNHCKSI